MPVILRALILLIAFGALFALGGRLHRRGHPLAAAALRAVTVFVLLLLILRLPQGSAVVDSTVLPPLDLAAYAAAARERPAEIGRHGGRISLAVSAAPDSWNEPISNNNATRQVVSFIFEGLVDQDPFTLDDVPHLAESWEVDASGLVYTFHLRRDVRWQDGHPFTADDVVFTYNDIYYNKDIPTGTRQTITIEVEDPDTGEIVGKQIRVEKLDRYTVRMTAPVRFAPFLGAARVFLYPRHILKKCVDEGTFTSVWDIGTDPREVVGTGPFRLHSYTFGERIVLHRNPDYWQIDEIGQRLPYLDEVSFVISSDINARTNLFQTGATDYVQLPAFDYPLLKPLEESGDFTISRLGPNTGMQFLCINLNTDRNPDSGDPYVPPHKQKWFNNRTFRRALAYAIDKQSMIELSQNSMGYSQWAVMGPSAGYFHATDVRRYHYDPGKSRQLLDSLGWIDRDGDGWREDDEGREIEFILYKPAGSAKIYCNVMIEDFRAVGLHVHLKDVEWNKLIKMVDNDYDWDLVFMGFTGATEPHWGRNLWASKSDFHLWHPKQATPTRDWEARIDELFRLGAAELDRARRKEIYDEWQEIVADQLPIILLTLGERMYALRNKFGNVNPTPYAQTLFYGVFHNLEHIYVRPGYEL